MYEISRGMKSGVPLTTAQRRSSLFQEEPTVLGRILRRGGPPMLIVDEVFEANEAQLKRLVDAGSITICKLGPSADSIVTTEPVSETPVIEEPVPETPPVVEEPPIPLPGDVAASTLETVPGVEAQPLVDVLAESSAVEAVMPEIQEVASQEGRVTSEDL